METLAQFVNATWLSSLIGLIAILISYTLYRASRRGGEPAVAQDGDRLLGGELPSNVEILFSGRHVPRLTRSRVVFWNRGSKTIPGEDIVQKDHPRMVVGEDAEILSARVVKTTRQVIGFRVGTTEKKNSVSIAFDYLDPGR